MLLLRINLMYYEVMSDRILGVYLQELKNSWQMKTKYGKPLELRVFPASAISQKGIASDAVKFLSVHCLLSQLQL